MEIQQFRKEMVGLLSIIPEFINTTSTFDNYVWHKMLYSSEILIQLLIDRIIPIRKIQLIIEQFDNEMECIVDETDQFMNVSLYYIKYTEYVLNKSIKEERYEVATNFRNFIDLYYNQNNNTNNNTNNVVK
jgi:hypothetical protein